MTDTMKIICGYLIDRPIYRDEDIKQYLDNISTFLPYVDKMYIYNQTNSDVSKFLSLIPNPQKLEYASVSGYGEAELYKEIVERGLNDKADYITMLKPGYFYEESVFPELKKYLYDNTIYKIAVLTPMPLLACEIHERKAEEYRTIKGCRLIGALLNLKIYQESPKIRTDFYQTTFDYEYCLRIRNLGYDVVLAQNLAFRNQNYKTLIRKFGLITLQGYDRDLMDVYYETRNRLYLWEEYKNIDPAYIRIDKKLFKAEKQEIRTRDKHWRDKYQMIAKAKEDYHNRKTGKINEK